MEATSDVNVFPVFSQLHEVVIPDRDCIEDPPEERDDTGWQDFLIYCAEVQS